MNADTYLSPQVPYRRMPVFWSARLLGEMSGRITHAFDMMTWAVPQP